MRFGQRVHARRRSRTILTAHPLRHRRLHGVHRRRASHAWINLPSHARHCRRRSSRDATVRRVVVIVRFPAQTTFNITTSSSKRARDRRPARARRRRHPYTFYARDGVPGDACDDRSPECASHTSEIAMQMRCEIRFGRALDDTLQRDDRSSRARDVARRPGGYCGG